MEADLDRSHLSGKRAVALEYGHGRLPVPIITASGRGAAAERIVALAREHDVPVCEDPLLAQILSTFDPGQAIPAELYAAVAEVLAWVYHLEGQVGRVNRQARDEREPLDGASSPARRDRTPLRR